VATGTLNAQQAFITGRIRLTGDQQKLLASTPVFVALDSVFATVREFTRYE
jgi:putative sterol carrier protein